MLAHVVSAQRPSFLLSVSGKIAVCLQRLGPAPPQTTSQRPLKPALLCPRTHACACVFADIQPGQGLYYQLTTQTYRARNCDINNYGVAAITYGLTPFPCRCGWLHGCATLSALDVLQL